MKLSRRRILLNGLIRPSKMLLFSPLVLSVSLYMAFTYGVLYLLFTTIPTVFQQQYGFSVGITGLVYISLGAGNMAGWAVDHPDRRTRASCGGPRRTTASSCPRCASSASSSPASHDLLWYGWTSYYQTHWIAPILGLFPSASASSACTCPSPPTLSTATRRTPPRRRCQYRPAKFGRRAAAARGAAVVQISRAGLG